MFILVIKHLVPSLM